MHWFAEHGLLNGVTIAKRYFPELAETEKTSVKKRVLQLEVLGSLRITEQTTTAVRGRKRQELLALLLEARISGRREVPRLTLIEVLYPDDDELKASSSLTSIIHSLRETFGESVILTTASGYTLGNCTSDAEVFLQTGDTLRWAGTYLEGLALSDESSVRDSLYLALADKATALLELDPKEAARVGSILIEAEPYRIEYLKIYLTALRLTNSHGKLARHYQDARERFLEVGETLPDTWQDLLSQSE
jgi:DNA-binding SARP family transcriptional activator